MERQRGNKNTNLMDIFHERVAKPIRLLSESIVKKSNEIACKKKRLNVN